MDLKDMILVTENDRGTETNMLMTLDDYKSFIAVDDIACKGKAEHDQGEVQGVAVCRAGAKTEVCGVLQRDIQ